MIKIKIKSWESGGHPFISYAPIKETQKEKLKRGQTLIIAQEMRQVQDSAFDPFYFPKAAGSRFYFANPLKLAPFQDDPF